MYYLEFFNPKVGSWEVVESSADYSRIQARERSVRNTSIRFKLRVINEAGTKVWSDKI